ncbi:non-canonical purine NTP pyrophosphatase [Candidatus Gracilibacteria bacterium]|nr:non-canonical purine NTP pyrophosphatase [Candidatus Gracilibacteria bacterium]
MKILIATGNEGKKKEMLEVFGKLKFVEWLFLKDFPKCNEPAEHGKTFEENALLKARFFGDRFGIPTIGEDSGLILDAYPEKFGVKTRREIMAKTDVEWLRIFLEMLESQKNRKATFYSSMAHYDPQTKENHIVLGKCVGQITEFPQAPLEKGIPVSAVFIPDGHDLVYSAMSKHEKNSVSHRGRAAHAIVEFLKKL